MNKKWPIAAIIVVPAAAIAIWGPQSLTPDGRFVAGILVLAAGLWFTELIPVAATALLIPVLAGLRGVMPTTPLVAPFAHPVIFLFLGGFLLARGMQKSGLDRTIATVVIRSSGASANTMLLSLIGTTAFLSMWMSNTATAALMIPIAGALAQNLGDHKRLVLAVAWSASIGGLGSAIGTPANMLGITFLNDYTGTNLTFKDWFGFGLPMVIILLPALWLYLRCGATATEATLPAQHTQDLPYDSATPFRTSLNRKGKIVLSVFLGTITLWLTESWHGLSSSLVAILGASLLFVTQVLDKSDFQKISWDTLLTFGGGLTLGLLLTETGVSKWLAAHLSLLGHLPQWGLLLCVSFATMVIGAFISNTACAAMLIPVAMPLSDAIGIDKVTLVAVITVASSIDFSLIIGTPPTMLAYATGLFETSEIFKKGLGLNLLSLAILNLIVIHLWRYFASY